MIRRFDIGSHKLRAVCPQCGHLRALNNDGSFRTHQNSTHSAPCAGSRRTPEQVRSL